MYVYSKRAHEGNFAKNNPFGRLDGTVERLLSSYCTQGQFTMHIQDIRIQH